jgi:release factor glutamine methyltransferase
MTIQDALREGYSVLFYAEVETPMLDSIVLLAEALGMTKEALYASLPVHVGEKHYSRFREFLRKRCSGIPVSYICRRKEFYGKEFFVDERVLVPRPDTEVLVEYVLSLSRQHPWIKSIHDACTGSGCIAIMVKLLFPGADVSASDISGQAGEVFRINSRRILGNDTDIPFVVSDLLEAVNGKFDMIVANPPYVKDEEVGNLKKIGWPEPVIALKGGADGASVTERLIVQAPHYIEEGGFLVLESAPEHMEILRTAMEKGGFKEITVVDDLGQRPRVISGRFFHE